MEEQRRNRNRGNTSNYIFRAILSSPLSFAKTITLLSKLIEDVNIELSSEEFKILTMDASQTCVVEFVMFARSFTQYYCMRNMSIGIRLANLVGALKNVRSDDFVTLILLANDPDSLFVKVDKVGTSQSITFKMAQMIILNQDTFEMPERHYSCGKALWMVYF
jgi:DNA polymerase III sliding clamp (beta) subunit (PCNA family)